MPDRLAFLEKLAQTGKADAFAHYALAMEYRKSGRAREALGVFAELRGKEAGYLPMYLMAGQLLLEMEAPAQARVWLDEGLQLARQQGDSKAVHELEEALREC